MDFCECSKGDPNLVTCNKCNKVRKSVGYCACAFCGHLFYIRSVSNIIQPKFHKFFISHLGKKQYPTNVICQRCFDKAKDKKGMKKRSIVDVCKICGKIAHTRPFKEKGMCAVCKREAFICETCGFVSKTIDWCFDCSTDEEKYELFTTNRELYERLID